MCLVEGYETDEDGKEENQGLGVKVLVQEGRGWEATWERRF